MKPIKISMIMAIIALFQAAPVANALTISCQAINPTTGLPQTTFHPGDKVLLEVTPGFSETIAANKQILLTTHISATISGITLPFTLSASSIGPDTRPPGGGALFQHGTEKTVYTIPPKFPNGSITITVQVTIQNVGSATCSHTFTIQNTTITK